MSHTGVFALPISDCQKELELGLDICQTFWSALDQAEVKAHEFSAVRKVRTDVAWSGQVWPREVLLALARLGFRWVPPQVADTIATLFRGFGHSLVNENANKSVKDQLRDNTGNKLARERRYYIPIVKAIISTR